MNTPFKQKFIRSLNRDDMTYRLMCWEKEPPCHRFILKEIIENCDQKYEGIEDA